MPWIALAGAALGAGASLYGANKQSKAAKEAATLNDQRQAEQNAAAWANYLMTRGVNPAGAKTGQIPVNPQAINARLPLWATANFSRPGATRTWRKKGSVTPANTLTRGASPVYPAASLPAPSYLPSSAETFDGVGNPMYNFAR